MRKKLMEKSRRTDGRRTGPARSSQPTGLRGVAAVVRRGATLPALIDLGAAVVAVVVAAIFTGYNIFDFPNYELDEGTYVGSAWAMFERGQLSYYTYTYDHPLLGWFQIGAWAELVGGFLAFGTSVNTGRVLMLVVTVVSTLLIFLIVRWATGRATAALLSGVIFAVSPLGVGLHRQVWLDNVATLWLLVSLYALLAARGGLGRVVLSALAFSLAFWSKETMAVFLPGMLYIAFAHTPAENRRFAFALWGTFTASAVSLFAVLALLKDEFFPPGVLWSSPQPHVSLLETLGYQASRGGGGSFLDPGSDFRTFLGQWVAADPMFVLGGLAAAGLGLLFWRRDRFLFGVSLLALSYLLFLGRGGVVLHFYVIPLVALLALALGLLAGHALGVVVRSKYLGRPAALALLALAVFVGTGAVRANDANFTGDRTSPQSAATRWIAENLPNESVVLMDAYPWADLRDEALVGDEPFENAHYYLAAQEDPAVREEVLGNDWRNIDYLVYSPTTEPDYSWIDGQLNDRPLPLVREARANSDKIKTFRSDDWAMEILRVRNLHGVEAPENPILQNTWESYKERFVKDGRVVDPKAGGLTTSEGQAYALLRAVYMDDREAFEEVWGWTRDELLLVREDGLLAWKYGTRPDGTLGVTDESSATDADTDAALALLFAARRWDEPAYKKEALEVLDGVWEEETVVVGSPLAGEKRVVVAGDWARGDATEEPVVNPSYLSPYAYKIFAEADPGHRWDDLVDSSYEILGKVSESPELGGEAGLAPDWLALDPHTGELLPTDVVRGAQASGFSYDASRIPWRIALDYLWFYDERALETLEGLSFPRRELEREGRLFAAYNPDGSPAADHEATSAYAGVLPGLLFGGDQDTAHRVFAEKILGDYTDGPEGAYWGEDPDDYYNQNMAWFATAVMDGSMGNLWAGASTIDWDEYPVFEQPLGADRAGQNLPEDGKEK